MQKQEYNDEMNGMTMLKYMSIHEISCSMDLADHVTQYPLHLPFMYGHIFQIANL